MGNEVRYRESFVVLGTAFLAIGLVFVWVGMPRSHSFTCNRLSGDSIRDAFRRVDCQKQEIVLGAIPIQTVLLKNIKTVGLGKGENAYDSTVYFIDFRGDSSRLMFGNSLYLEDVRVDLQRSQEFLKDSKIQSLRIERHEVDYFFAIAGILVSALGVSLLRWKGMK